MVNIYDFPLNAAQLAIWLEAINWDGLPNLHAELVARAEAALEGVEDEYGDDRWWPSYDEWNLLHALAEGRDAA